VLLGGFLGSGKTTALLRIARQHVDKGRRVGIITNDQAEDLVDTATFRSAGFDTEEIPDGCFCCKFDEFVAAADRLVEQYRPDVILAEPVGSCTDLVATVLRPLQELHDTQFRLSPYVTLLDPFRAREALDSSGSKSLHQKVLYVFTMQQNEADVVAVNKVDLLGPTELDQVLALVRRSFPKATAVVPVSAKTGEGFDELTRLVDGGGAAGTHPTEVDYDIYAEGEAALGWLNATWTINDKTSTPGDVAIAKLADSIRQELANHGLEPAHVKLLLRADGMESMANIVASGRRPEVRQARQARQEHAGRHELLINARVQGEPDRVRNCVERAVANVAAAHGLDLDAAVCRSFAPARPEPVHRRTGS
jgi:Ni2+-binding GTPase involved in maturation of urease and hydrogenase